MKRKAQYGIDAPGVIFKMFMIGLALAAAAFLIPAWKRTFLTSAFFVALSPTLMLLYSLRGKYSYRDHLLGRIRWAGNETVLDVGTGRGLLMIGAAHRVASGRSVGIDIWSQQDLSNNRAEHALKNAELEGVASRVEVRSEDVRRMSFADASFDVIVSNLCLHNIDEAEGRQKACQEIARVLKPGGRVLISDMRHAHEYADAFKNAGLDVTVGLPLFWKTFPPLRIVEAVK